MAYRLPDTEGLEFSDYPGTENETDGQSGYGRVNSPEGYVTEYVKP
jgi:hypothetical protein